MPKHSRTTQDVAQQRAWAQLSLSERWDAQAEKTPDAIAVSFEDAQLTYQALNNRANQLAHYLQTLGVKPEVLVGICLERSLEQATALLGILKAGGAYVALDPSYPRDRLSLILEDTQAPVLLTQQSLTGALPDHGAQVVLLDSDQAAIAKQSLEDVENVASPNNLLYITYTSGSTGKPKGIAMPQLAILNLLEWQLRHYRLIESMRTLQLASLNFDVSCQEIFSTWLSGGTVVMIPEALRKNARGLSRFIVDAAINRLFIPAVALQQLVEGFLHAQKLPTQLQYVISGSEQLHITQAMTELFLQLPNCTLHNEYGPSETHVATYFDLPRSPLDWPSRPPIGQPIANTQVYLLNNEEMQPSPSKETGEVYIGGLGVARGYLNRPEKTRECFVSNPFDPEGNRLYKTGDLARYRPDGVLEFLGRIDHQVKIRGFRIELGEIEAALAQHPLVRETVVIAREDVPGDKRLVAYVVLFQQTSTVNELRQFLQQRLPDYMLPTTFVQLDALPLNPSRKVDRGALPAPDKVRPNLTESYLAPRSALEEKLVAIWQDVLDMQPVGVHDDFLDLGGDSLRATRVINRIREIFSAEVSIGSLLGESTVARQAQYLAALNGNAQGHGSVEEGDREQGDL
ncbi:MAG: amino acid adenylation domain-containing protein [Cyanobacteria bacterium J06638_28]